MARVVGEIGCRRFSAMKAAKNICQVNAHSAAIIAAAAVMSRSSQRGGQRFMRAEYRAGFQVWDARIQNCLF